MHLRVPSLAKLRGWISRECDPPHDAVQEPRVLATFIEKLVLLFALNSTAIMLIVVTDNTRSHSTARSVMLDQLLLWHFSIYCAIYCCDGVCGTADALGVTLIFFIFLLWMDSTTHRIYSDFSPFCIYLVTCSMVCYCDAVQYCSFANLI